MSEDNNQSRIHEALRKRAQKMHEAQWSDFISRYPLNILFPARVKSSDDDKKLRTDLDLINARLLENGILFEGMQTLPEVQMGITKSIDNLMRTGCFNSVRFELGVESNKNETNEGGNPTAEEVRHNMKVILDEKNWYSLYIGGGFKHGGFEESMNQGGARLPKAQFESSATLLNLTGSLDQSRLQYTVDQTACSTFLLSHERPVYAWFDENGDVASTLLAFEKGSQYSLSLRAMLDTVDYEWTRSYKEHHKMLSCRLDNQGRVARPEMAPIDYWGLDWSLLFRDIVPRKHAEIPYAADASPEIVTESGPSTLHSLTWEVRSNGALCDDRFQPTAGVDYHSKIQIAGPPGDVGFAKVQGGASFHFPIIGDGAIALHTSVTSGIMTPLSYYGICRPPTISDRFFVGGPMQLRGFLPAGIGPRSQGKGGSVTAGGDALGGSMFYAASVAASVAPPGILSDYGVRLFGFANTGSLAGTADAPISALVRSARIAAGGGISAATPMGRLEITYAWPLRFGPRDCRRNVQVGFGFHYG